MKGLLGFAALLAFALAKENHCPEQWHLADGGHECLYFSHLNEHVTKEDAKILCHARHSWLLDFDEEHAAKKYNQVRRMIHEMVGDIYDDMGPGPVMHDQWWVGAKVHGPHDDHNYGNWTWDHGKTEVTWFDWMEGQPNDFHNENCLTMQRLQDALGHATYHWNDWACQGSARYVCERLNKPHNETQFFHW